MAEEENLRIIGMNNLMPMSAQWQRRTGEQGTMLVFLDFVAEKVFDAAGSEVKDEAGEAIRAILIKKKRAAMNLPLPEAVIENVAKRRESMVGQIR